MIFLDESFTPKEAKFNSVKEHQANTTTSDHNKTFSEFNNKIISESSTVQDLTKVKKIQTQIKNTKVLLFNFPIWISEDNILI